MGMRKDLAVWLNAVVLFLEKPLRNCEHKMIDMQFDRTSDLRNKHPTPALEAFEAKVKFTTDVECFYGMGSNI